MTIMTMKTFTATLTAIAPPPDIRPALVALWHAGRDEWEAAHAIAQNIDEQEGSWVHAYLHRVEGDASNAAYWYRRAGRPVAHGPFRAEWDTIVEELLRVDA